jgi:hypothetical protein
VFTGYEPKDKIDIEKTPPSPILYLMTTKRNALVGKNARDERGDPSDKALKVTIVVCLIGLVAVYLFAFAPKKGGVVTSPTPSPARAESSEAVAKFDRDSLSTKSR